MSIVVKRMSEKARVLGFEPDGDFDTQRITLKKGEFTRTFSTPQCALSFLDGYELALAQQVAQ